MDSTIPTAEEFLNSLESKFQKTGRPFFYKDALKAFAKLHVKKALEKAHSTMQLPDEDLEFTLNAYPLTNIK